MFGIIGISLTHGLRAPAIAPGRRARRTPQFRPGGRRPAHQPARALTQHPEPGAPVRQRACSCAPPPASCPTDLGRLYIERARDLLRMADELEGEAIGHAAHAHRAGGRRRWPVPDGLVPGTGGGALRRAVSASQRTTAFRQLGRPRPAQLRSRTLDFFVAETSLLAREPDLDVVPMPARHPVYFIARARHPLDAKRRDDSGGRMIRLALRHSFANPAPGARSLAGCAPREYRATTHCRAPFPRSHAMGSHR